MSASGQCKSGKTSKMYQECFYECVKLPDNNDMGDMRFTFIGRADGRIK